MGDLLTSDAINVPEGIASADSHVLVTQDEPGLSNSSNLGALGTGLLLSQVTGGIAALSVIPLATAATAAADSAPAGGTGASAGAWDTAAHRDTAITAINNLQIRMNEVIACLQAAHLMS